MNRRLHLITTCTRRKAGSVEDTVFPGDTSLDDAFDGWYRLIAQAARRPGRVLETGERALPGRTLAACPRYRGAVAGHRAVGHVGRSGAAPPYRSGGRV